MWYPAMPTPTHPRKVASLTSHPNLPERDSIYEKDGDQKRNQLTRTGLEGRHGVDPVDNGVWTTAGTQVELGDCDGAHVRRDVHPVIGARPAGGAGWRAGRKGEFGIGRQQRRASTLNGCGSPVMQKGQSLAGCLE